MTWKSHGALWKLELPRGPVCNSNPAKPKPCSSLYQWSLGSASHLVFKENKKFFETLDAWNVSLLCTQEARWLLLTKKKRKSLSQILLWLQCRVSYLPCRFCPLIITFHAAATSGLLSAWPDILTHTPRLFTAAKQKYWFRAKKATAERTASVFLLEKRPVRHALERKMHHGAA